MAIFRVQKTQNYTVLSNYHFKEKGMSLKAKGLLSLMLSLPDTWNYTIAGLVKLSKDGKDSVMSALTELEKFNYLERKRTTNEKGQFTGIEYIIYEQPQPITEKPISDNSILEKPISDKPTQLNTKALNTENNKLTYDINNYKEILDTIGDIHLKELYIDFIENRAYMGAPLTKKGLELLRERLRELAGLNISKQKQLLQTAIINNWKNVYAKGEEPVENEILDELKNFYR